MNMKKMASMSALCMIIASVTVYGGSENDGHMNVIYGNGAGAALPGNDTAEYNTLLGYESGNTLASGFDNTFVGADSGSAATAGTENSFFGSNSGANSSGNQNTFIGAYSGNQANASNSVFIGYRAGYNAAKDSTLYIDNTDTETPLIYGEFENDMLRINGMQEINASKKDVSDSQNGSEWGYFALTMQANDIPDKLKWQVALYDGGDDTNRSLMFYNPNSQNAPLQVLTSAKDNLLQLNNNKVVINAEDTDSGSLSSDASLVVGGSIKAAWTGSNTFRDGLSILTRLSANNSASGKTSDVGFGLRNVVKNFQWNFRTIEYNNGFTATKLGSGGGEFIVQSPTNDYHDARMIVGGVTIFENGHLVDSSGNPIAALIQQQSIRLAKTEKALQQKESMIVAMQTEIAAIKTVSKEKDRKIALLEKKQQQQALKITELETMRQKVAMLENLLTNLALNTSKTEKSKVSLLEK